MTKKNKNSFEVRLRRESNDKRFVCEVKRSEHYKIKTITIVDRVKFELHQKIINYSNNTTNFSKTHFALVDGRWGFEGINVRIQ